MTPVLSRFVIGMPSPGLGVESPRVPGPVRVAIGSPY